MVAPVHRSVIHEFETAEQFGEVMADAGRGYLYSRIRNPSLDELAEAVAVLERAERGLCFASGMAAINAGIELLAPDGGTVVAGDQLYGQTHSLLRRRASTRIVDVRDPHAVAHAAQGAALVYAETISNPRGSVADIEMLARAAHSAGALLMIDNTLATPMGCRPLDLGADLVVHSATKYLNGHSDVLAGVAAGPAELIGRLAERAVDAGSTLSPDSAWLVRRGMRTLPLRWERACGSAQRVAEHLEAHPAVRRVLYPGLPSHPDHALATRMLRGCGGVLTFEVEGGRTGGERVMNRVALCIRATSLGGVETVISHPASTSHRQLSDAELEAAGISQGSLRLAVGCEDVDDLLEDLDRALPGG